MIRRVWKAELMDYPKTMLLIGIAPVAGWVFGVLLSLLIRFMEGDAFYIPLGGVLSIFGGICVLLFSVTSAFSAGFETAVKMGSTRRAYLIADTLFALLLVLSAAVIVFALILLEIPVGMLIAPEWITDGFALTFEIVALVPWYVWVLLPIAVVIVGAFVGALFSRFGKTAFWIMYVLWFAPMLLGGPIADMITAGDKSTPIAHIVVTVAEALAVIPVGVWIALGCLVPVALAVFTVVILMKKEIKA